jgi:AbiV family abortive infection protein
MLLGMAKRLEPIPDHEDLAALIAAVLTNAESLIDGAADLLVAGRWPLVHAIATLGFEEIGKSQLCLIFMIAPAPVRESIDFWASFRGHLPKIGLAHMLHTMLASANPIPTQLPAALDALDQVARADNAAKFRGLYVDFKDGSVLQPTDVLEESARLMVTNARTCLAYTKVLHEAALEPAFAQFIREYQAALEGCAEEISAAINADPETFLRTVREASTSAMEGLMPSGSLEVTDTTGRALLPPFPKGHR